MDGLVSLLDQSHHDRVEVLFDLLEDRCGLQGIRMTPYPHFSWQTAESFDELATPAALQEWADNQAPFSVHTNGIGLFSGSEPVLYLQIIRTPRLNHLHEQLWKRFSALRNGESPYYAPEAWMPHIALAMGDLTLDKLGCAVGILARQPFEWEIHINNLAVLFQPAGQRARLGYRYAFQLDKPETGE